MLSPRPHDDGQGRAGQLLSPREYDFELVKMDEQWLFISRTVLRVDRKFSIP